MHGRWCFGNLRVPCNIEFASYGGRGPVGGSNLLSPHLPRIRNDKHASIQWEEAGRQIDAAIVADPKSPEAHNFRGTLLDRSGSRAEALNEFLEAIRLRPNFGTAHLNAARMLAAKGDTAAAELHLRQAAASPDPNIRQKAAAALQQLAR